MYKKILVPYDKSEPAQHALSAALDLAAGVPDAQITVLSVVDWHDFNAETFKIASRMSGVMGDAMDMNVMAEVESEAIKADTDAIAESIASLVGDAAGVGIAVVNGSRLHHRLRRRGRLRLHRYGPSRPGRSARHVGQCVLFGAA